jgi:hypothetical protein
MFRQGAAAYRKVTNRHSSQPDVYACPLCGVQYGLSSLDEGELTEDHVPPRALGGKPITLTCRRCNSQSGHVLDAALVNRERNLMFIEALARRRKSFQGRIVLKIAGQEVNVDMAVKGDSVTLSVPGEHNDPATVEELEAALQRHVDEGTWDGESFGITLQRGYHDKNARAGDLRAAYLVAFAALGYRYVASSALEPVRDQIANPTHDIIPGFWIAPKELEKPPFLLLLFQPVHALLVSFPRAAVILPWLGGPLDPYSEIRAKFTSGREAQFKGTSLRWPERMELILDFAGEAP